MKSCKKDIVKFFDNSGNEYVLKIPTLFEYLLYNSRQFERVWNRLYISDLPRPKYWRRILDSIFNEIFPSSFLSDTSVFDVGDEDNNWLFTLALNLHQAFGYKPHEILKMNPYEISFVAALFDFYMDVMNNEAAAKYASGV